MGRQASGGIAHKAKLKHSTSWRAGSNSTRKVFEKYTIQDEDEAMEFVKDNRDEVKDYKVIKFVRNPYKRAVSSFVWAYMFYQNLGPSIHEIHHKYGFHWVATDMKHSRINKKIYSANRDEFTFIDFLTILKENKQNIEKCHGHFRAQYNKADSYGFIQKQEEGFEKLNKEFDLELEKELKHTHDKIQLEEPCDKTPLKEVMDVSNWRNVMPDYKYFLTDEAKELIYEIYQKDFETFNYDK